MRFKTEEAKVYKTSQTLFFQKKKHLKQKISNEFARVSILNYFQEEENKTTSLLISAS